jgi:hypothetical protein
MIRNGNPFLINREFIKFIEKLEKRYSDGERNLDSEIKKIYHTYFINEKGENTDYLNFDSKYYVEIKNLYKETQDNPCIFKNSKKKVLFGKFTY